MDVLAPCAVEGLCFAGLGANQHVVVRVLACHEKGGTFVAVPGLNHDILVVLGRYFKPLLRIDAKHFKGTDGAFLAPVILTL